MNAVLDHMADPSRTKGAMARATGAAFSRLFVAAQAPAGPASHDEAAIVEGADVRVTADQPADAWRFAAA
jgi:hypothetical protein